MYGARHRARILSKLNIAQKRPSGIVDARTIYACKVAFLFKDSRNMKRPARDLKGQKFGRLTVIEWVGRNKYYANLWKCMCECGKESIVQAQSLTSGRTRSCGCLIGETAIKTHTSHKSVNTRIYHIWDGMIQRCTNPNHDSYPRYGGKGIKVCEEWRDFKTFYNWAMDNGYQENLTIDRSDNDGNYEPSNCRWRTYKEQNRNKSDNVFLTYNGETHTMMEWAEKTGICYGTLQSRIKNYKWPVERALTEPVHTQYAKR